ncbi:EAL domain-containing protein [Acaryochloris sp. 'Moss Beach']|uniref:EAL domain-containing protein n=1 Tax=Acaryochloris sp. 'Moss Beach' TaxID=2740837 RepID=UPI001F22329C|nr:EAL domain-containing protein [Acaryochloris sp. 'Moss Beach']UJB67686.1 EAL domain-containing protein [Acaryochloris sp. 'Moss Beach']
MVRTDLNLRTLDISVASFNQSNADQLRKMSQKRYGWLWKIAILPSLAIGLVTGTPDVKAEENILVIHSYHPELSWTDQVKQGIDQSFQKRRPEAKIFHEYLDGKRLPALEHSQSFLELIQEKYQKIPLDALMVSDDPGLQLILQVRDQYFPKVPIVFLGINHVQPELYNVPGLTGVFEKHSVAQTVQVAKQLTGADGLIVINDSTETGQANIKRINEIKQLPNVPQSIAIIHDVTPEDLPQRLSAFPSTWPVLPMGQLRQGHAKGKLINFEMDTQILRDKLPNPLFTATVMRVGPGAVGGKVLEGGVHADQAVRLVEQILDGANPTDLEPIAESKNLWMFDARELKRFRINPRDLPVGSMVLYSEPSFYDQHQGLVWVVFGAFSSSLVMIALLIEVLRRRAQVEKTLRDNEKRYKDLAEVGANTFWELDINLNLSYVSDRKGYQTSAISSQAIGLSLTDVFADEEMFEFNTKRLDTILHWRRPIQDFIFFAKEDNQEMRIFKLNGKPIVDDAQLFQGYRGIQRDITEEYFLTKKIAYQAAYDSLTNLLNRSEFDNRLQESVDQAREDKTKFVLCYLDLDQFKLVNDTAGHMVGDQLLTELAQLLKQKIRPDDVLGRLGGDEFGLLMQDCSLSEAQACCEMLVTTVQTFRFQWQDSQFRVGVSVGIVAFADASYTSEELLSRADLACYKAKDAGRGRVYVANQNDRELDHYQLQMAHIADIPQAIEEDRLFLVKQPILNINQPSALFRHYEILLRLRDGKNNIIGPGLFIPAAERYGVIGLIDKWVLENTLRQYYQCGLKDVVVSINLSGASINDERAMADVIALITQSNVPPSNICIEITETATIAQLDQALRFIESLKKIGVKFALDDFGSGVSSLSYLKSLPVDYLKIDGSLVKNIAVVESDREIIYLINELAHKRGMKTIAEFVENEQILEQLRIIGVDYAQGYGIGKPEPLAVTQLMVS